MTGFYFALFIYDRSIKNAWHAIDEKDINVLLVGL
jgi:hypothetical protein